MAEAKQLEVPSGFRAAGVKAGIKPSGTLDLAVLVADRNCAAAGTFTTNRVCAAPVRWDRALVPSDVGPRRRHQRRQRQRGHRAQGEENARRTADPRRGAARAASPSRSSSPRPASSATSCRWTGSRPAWPRRWRRPRRRRRGFQDASRAILTTDSHPKVVSLRRTLGGQPVALLGLAKGAAMIGPSMATMLAFLLTDARVGRARPPGDPLRGGRGLVQLHLGRGAHEHQRHRAAAGQRCGRERARSGATTSRSSPRWSARRA